MAFSESSFEIIHLLTDDRVGWRAKERITIAVTKTVTIALLIMAWIHVPAEESKEVSEESSVHVLRHLVKNEPVFLNTGNYF